MQQNQDYANCQYVNDYKLHFLLGEGGQANVYLGSKGKNLYALKIYLAGMNKDEAFKRQVQFLEKLKFKYLINIVDSDFNAEIKLKGSKPQKRAMIALQMAEGQMFDFISKEGRFTPEVTRTLFKQLVEAIKFLDDRGITHRDLKPENILFDKDFNLKVSDFGLSTFTEGYEKDGKLYSRVGTEGYKSPEMQMGNYTGLQADLFAAGVILFIMYNGTPPFLSTKPHEKIYKLIKDKQFTKFWSLHEKKKPLGFYPDSFKRLCNEFFSFDPTKRPTFQSLSEDEWMTGQILMGNDLKEYMLKRYEKIAETDEVKKKISLLRKQMLIDSLMEEQSQASKSESQSEDSTRKADVKVFVERFKQYQSLKASSLPQTDLNITYLDKEPAFVLAFLKDFIEECARNNTVFLEQFLQEIAPSYFQMKIHQNEVSLKFAFQIDEEDQQILKVKGKLYQQNNKVGIAWQKIQGNDFWLTSIIKQLNQRLNVLA